MTGVHFALVIPHVEITRLSPEGEPEKVGIGRRDHELIGETQYVLGDIPVQWEFVNDIVKRSVSDRGRWYHCLMGPDFVSSDLGFVFDVY